MDAGSGVVVGLGVWFGVGVDLDVVVGTDVGVGSAIAVGVGLGVAVGMAVCVGATAGIGVRGGIIVGFGKGFSDEGNSNTFSTSLRAERNCNPSGESYKAQTITAAEIIAKIIIKQPQARLNFRLEPGGLPVLSPQ